MSSTVVCDTRRSTGRRHRRASRGRWARFDRGCCGSRIIAVLLFLVVSPFVYLVLTSFQAETTGAFTLPTTPPPTAGRATSRRCSIRCSSAPARRPGRHLRRAARLGGVAHRHAGPRLRPACWCSATFITPPYLGAVGWILLAGPNAGWLNRIYVMRHRRRGGAVQHLQLHRPRRRHRALLLPLHLHLHHGGARAGVVGDGGCRQHPGRRHLRTMRRVTLPLVLPAILGGLIICFLEAIALFGSPALIAHSGALQRRHDAALPVLRATPCASRWRRPMRCRCSA